MHKLVSPHQLDPLSTEHVADTKLLATQWNLTLHAIGIKGVAPSLQRYTRRELESNFAKVYDPLGLLLPFRVLLQATLHTTVVRDGSVSAQVRQTTRRLAEELQHLETIQVPRPRRRLSLRLPTRRWLWPLDLRPVETGASNVPEQDHCSSCRACRRLDAGKNGGKPREDHDCD